MAIVTRAQLVQYLEQLDGHSEEDPLLDAVIERAESIVTEYLGFTFTDYDDPATERVITAYGTSTLVLPPHEIGSVDSVTLHGSTTEITDWEEDAITGNLTFQGWLPFGSTIYGQAWGAFSPFGYWGPGRYAVTAAWGYGTPPAALAEVVLELAVNIWRGRDRGMWTDIVGVEGSGGLRFTGGITNQQRAILDSIREKYAGSVAI